MPVCPHCNESYTGEVERCPNCDWIFKPKIVVNEARLKAERERAEHEQAEKEAANRIQLLKSHATIGKMQQQEVLLSTLLKNARYEYTTTYVPDVGGFPDIDGINRVLMSHAESGWRLHSALCNEVGKNVVSGSVAGIRLGTNATVDVVILIFERRVKPEEA